MVRALLAQQAGFRAIYLSGGVAAGSLALLDLGLSHLDDILIDIGCITDVCDLPILVDAEHPTKIRLLIVDDEPLARSNIAVLGAYGIPSEPGLLIPFALEQLTERHSSSAE